MKVFYQIIVVFLFLFISEATFAASPPPPDPGQIPLDPMSWVLLGAGGAIAAKKYYDKNKTK